MNITLEQLQSVMPQAGKRAELFLEPLNKAMEGFGIDSKARTAAFLAQVGHESGQLLYVKELASGAAYEGRTDLGNDSPGDGVKYKGRGLIQITGKANYTAMMLAMDIDCLEHPEVVEEPDNAASSACWFWKTHNLNHWVDLGDFVTLTKRINGGTIGLADRMAIWERAKTYLPEPSEVVSTPTAVEETVDEQKPAQA